MKFIKNREVDSDSQRGSAEHRSSMTESPDVVLAYRDVGRGQLADQELQEARLAIRFKAEQTTRFTRKINRAASVR